MIHFLRNFAKIGVAFSVLMFGVLFFGVHQASALTIIWDNGGNDIDCGGVGTQYNWNCAQNWVGDVVPGAGDIAQFNNTASSAVEINSAVNVQGIDIESTYLSTIQVADGVNVTVGTAGFTQDAAGWTFLGGSNFDVNGDFIQTNGTFTAASANITVSGNVSTSPFTFTANTSTFTLDGTTDQTFDADGKTFNNLVINNTGGAGTDDIIVSANDLDVNGSFTLTDGDFDLGTNDPSVKFAGSFTIGALGSWTKGTKNVQFDGSGNQNYNTDNTNIGNAETLNSGKLLLQSDATFDALTTTGILSGITLNGNDVTITTLTNNGIFSLMGDETVSITTHNIGTGQWQYTGITGGGTVNVKDFGGTDYYILFLNDNIPGTSTTYNLTSTLTTSNDFTVAGDAIFSPAANNVVLGDDLFLTNTAQFTGGAGTLDVAGKVDLDGGTFTLPTGTFTVAGNWENSAATVSSTGSTVTFDGTADQTVTSNGQSFGSVILANSAAPGSSELIPTDTMTVSDDFTINDGELALNTNSATLNVGDDFILNNDFLDLGNGTLDVNGDLNFAGGFLSTLAGSINLAGNFTNGIGNNASYGTGTFTFDGGNQSITGANSFYNLKKEQTTFATLTFQNGVTQSINGTLTLTGSSGQLLFLKSSSAGNQFSLSHAGNVTTSYLDVQDSNNTSASITCSPGCGDAGNNTNWVFPSSSSSSVGGGGGSSPSANASVFDEPVGGFSVMINSGMVSTDDRNVMLTFNGGDDATRFTYSFNPSFTGASLYSYTDSMSVMLPDIIGEQTIYVKYYNAAGKESPVVQDSIMYNPAGIVQQPILDKEGKELVTGDLVKTDNSTTVYYYSSATNTRHAFPNIHVFLSWFTLDDLNQVKDVANDQIKNAALGKNMTYKPGTRLVKIQTDPRVYAIGYNNTLQWIETEDTAKFYYGNDWADRVDDINVAFFGDYTIGNSVNREKNQAPDSFVYEVNGNTHIFSDNKSYDMTPESAVVNAFDSVFVRSFVQSDADFFTDGGSIVIPDGIVDIVDFSQKSITNLFN